MAETRYERELFEKAAGTLDGFIKQIGRSRKRKEIDDEDETFLKAKAEEIQAALRQLP